MAKANDNGGKFLEVKVAGSKLAFIFGDGGRVEFYPGQCSDEIRQQAMWHGFNQKIRDSAAGFSKEKDYAGAREEMQAVIDALYHGAWKRQGGGAGAGVVMADLATAIAQMKGVDFERAMAAVEKANDEQRKGWMKNAKVQQLMAEAKAKRLAAATTDADDNLDIDLEGDGE